MGGEPAAQALYLLVLLLVEQLQLQVQQQHSATAYSIVWEDISRPVSMSVTVTLIRFFSVDGSAMIPSWVFVAFSHYE